MADNTTVTDDLRSKLEKTAAFIIEKSANSTISGNYFINADDIPDHILSPELFNKHVREIASIMEEYEAVQEVALTSSGEIDLTIFLDYCPNYEPLPEEAEDFPDNRKILDPLKSRRVSEPEKPTPTIPTPKPTLAERLEKSKQKAAAQAPSAVHKSKELEV